MAKIGREEEKGGGKSGDERGGEWKRMGGEEEKGRR